MHMGGAQPAVDGAALRALLAQPDAMRVEYQPVVGFDSRRIVGVEALLRASVDGVPVSPLRVIEAAQVEGLTRVVGRLVMDQACAALRRWRGAGFDGLILMVNVDATELDDPDLVADVDDTLRRHDIPSDRFLMELTETAFIDDSAVVRSNLAGLRALGIGLALDDFGTGYASLSHLRSVPLTTVKLDRQFIAGADRPGMDHEIVRNVIRLGHALGLRIVAEGVEHESQRAALERLGCDSWQGYLQAGSMDADAVLRALVDDVTGGADEGPPVDDCIVCDLRLGDAWAEHVDAFVLRRSGLAQWENVGGRGRGDVWAMAMVVHELDTPLLREVLAERRHSNVVVHVHHAEPAHLFGAYHGRSAVAVRTDAETIVVLGGGSRALSDHCGDDRWIRRAEAVAAEVEASVPGARLAGEEAVAGAVYSLLSERPSSLDEAMRRVIAHALEVQRCEFGFLYLAEDRLLAFDDASIHDVDRAALSAALDLMMSTTGETLLVQDAVAQPMPMPVPRGFEVRSWIAVPVPAPIRGLLVCAHTDRDPQGFTTLCRHAAEALAAAAVHVLAAGWEQDERRIGDGLTRPTMRSLDLVAD